MTRTKNPSPATARTTDRNKAFETETEPAPLPRRGSPSDDPLSNPPISKAIRIPNGQTESRS